MAARTVKALGNYRGYKALYKSMDEFYDNEVTVTYNGIIGRPRIRELQAAPSTAHGMLKVSLNGRIVTICSTILTPTECTTIVTTPKETTKKAKARHINFKVAIHLDFLDQEITIIGTAKKRGQASKCAKEIHLEVQKLVEAGILQEVYYHVRLSNPVMVKKHDGSWRMCVDFTDLNKACLQDCYPLPEIDWKVESLYGYPFKCFLDTYKGYHQIQMAEQDEEKTAFHTSHGTRGRFGHQESHGNIAATGYRRNVSHVTTDQHEAQSQKVYIRSSRRNVSRIHDQFAMDKTMHRQEEGRVTAPISTNNQREVYQKSDFHWTPDAEQAFKQLKQHLVELPMLVAPKPKEKLIMYLFASYGAISTVLMTERDTIQTPVYFMSRALQDPELNYTPMEKLVLALVCAAKRLRRYFQVHPIVVITDQPIKQVISRPDVAGQLQKWSVMLREHNIIYRSWTYVKGQILADFIVEKPNDAPPEASTIETPQELWTLFTDESSCVDKSSVGLILTNPEGTDFTYVLRFQFTASNNEADYEALIAGLRIVAQMRVRNVHVSIDSKLVANQVLGTYVTNEENMIKYLEKTESLTSGFANFSISQVPRSKNKKVDALSKIASTSFAHLSKQVLVEILKEKSIQEKEMATVVEEAGPT
uniref:Reverse transcriptase domain-containing protein n=1 Tax=Tanacetum cinerariifolium TaxID=118510 RepID=A0A699HB79_TANCI|nr:reverse transcriptase domain-containing protein [Tanacetum cinerariifolium]